MAKSSLVELAVFGGPPEFAQPLHVGRPNVGNIEGFFDRMRQAFETRRLTNDGPYAQEFERRIADAVGTQHCAVTCNGTAALEIALRATGLTGEVIVPAFTFVATVHALHWLGLTPIFCDIDPRTHTIDPAEAERLITPRTTALVGVHLWGRTCDVDALTGLALRHGLVLLFDAAHAFGCSYKGRPIGGLGAATIFSFHSTKVVNSFEGGAITTDDSRLAERIHAMKRFGFTDYDRVEYPGTNAKMSEAAAAMGLTSLDQAQEFVAVNQVNFLRYREGLARIPGVSLKEPDEAERSNFHYIVLDIDQTVTGLSRDLLMRVLHAENILARRYFYPGCHRMQPYRSLYPDAGRRLPHTELVASRVLCLPTGTAVTPDDIERILAIVRLGVVHGHDLTRREAEFAAGR